MSLPNHTTDRRRWIFHRPLWLLCLMFLAQPMTSLMAADVSTRPPMTLRPARLPELPPRVVGAGRDGVKRIAALRVEFITDTLSTTTGDGKFQYAVDDTMYFDPPPHDAQYFEDHLTFLRYYWQAMSNGALDIKWQIFPAGNQAAYQLPGQMWQYNYNQSEAQLDYGLARLFRDAVQAADSVENSGPSDGLTWDDYDLVLIFHAGAGAEFDLGYTTTPHDLPSAWMVAEDFDTLGLGGGIPVRVGEPIQGGLLLPETETHEGVQISMAGVMCSLFGHWLGLPPLYDNDPEDHGRSVVGKWSLMDRGFGNFYGAIPGRLDAWSRSYKGWLNPVEIQPGYYSIAAPGVTAPGAGEAYKIRINTNEYFLLSCRARDPENDKQAVAWDCDDRRMVFKEDYTVEAEPGFRVPVRIDNLDFDSPGSGILIWHVDESLRSQLGARRFNSVDERRGLDLEEADGAQDIGEDYPFLTPGWGTDYGIMADAWYSDNDFYKEANQGRLVSFNNESFPNSRSNSDAATGINLLNFSPRDTVMTFEYRRSVTAFTKSVPLMNHNPAFGAGNFAGSATRQEILYLADSIYVLNGDGSEAGNYAFADRPQAFLGGGPVIRDFNGDGLDDAVWCSINNQRGIFLTGATSSPFDQYEIALLDTFPRTAIIPRAFLVAGGEPGFESLLYFVLSQDQSSVLCRYDAALMRQSEFSLDEVIVSAHRIGTAISDSILLVSEVMNLYLWRQNELQLLGACDIADFAWFWNPPVAADFNGDGTIDLAMVGKGLSRQSLMFIPSLLERGCDDLRYVRLHNEPPVEAIIPIDVDRDGAYELLGFTETGELTALEINGVIADGFPRRGIRNSAGWLTDPAYPGLMTPLAADLTGNRRWDVLYIESWIELESETNAAHPFNAGSTRINTLSLAGQSLGSFPLEPGLTMPQIMLCQLDSLPDPEILVVGRDGVAVFNPTLRGDFEDVWWNGIYRDNDHSNAVNEPATPFTARFGLDLLPAAQCYNWPNPASGSTVIRYYLTADARMKIDVYDIMGEKVASMNGPGEAGFHHEITWDLTDVPRGAYIAIVKAESAGCSQTRKVKIAVR